MTKTETDNKSRKRPAEDVRAANRLRAWRPQSSSLSRDELRRIVLDTLG